LTTPISACQNENSVIRIIRMKNRIIRIANCGFTLRIGGFTFTELIVVVSIIAVLTSASIMGAINISQHARRVRARDDVQALIHGVLQYQIDMGFFPPDVWSGIDPGLTQPLPNNPYGFYPGPGGGIWTNDAGLPSNWQDIVNERWNGPYIEHFPQFTPWKGLYDYNYWPTPSACHPHGIYIGIQPMADTGANSIPAVDEQYFIDEQIDVDGCNNRYVQVLIQSLD